MTRNNLNVKKLIVAATELVENVNEFDGKITDQKFVDDVVKALEACVGTKDWNAVLDHVFKLKREGKLSKKKG